MLRVCVCSCQLGDLYERDPLGLELAEEYWCPSETNLSVNSTANASTSMYNFRPPQRQVSYRVYAKTGWSQGVGKDR